MTKRFFPILALLCMGCAVNPDVAMKLEKSPQDFKILIGEFNGSLALIHGSPKNATIQATDGSLKCSGASTTGDFKTDMRKNIVTHMFNMQCNNGVTGQLILKITLRGDGNASGAGVGNMSDGSKLKVIVGDMSGQLTW